MDATPTFFCLRVRNHNFLQNNELQRGDQHVEVRCCGYNVISVNHFFLISSIPLIPGVRFFLFLVRIMVSILLDASKWMEME